jgi:polysaccharide export outer membrane protein
MLAKRRTAAAADSSMNQIGFLVAMLASALLSGCASQSPVVVVAKASVETPYRFGSGDRLRIIVFGQDNLSNAYSVDGAGDISMPLIGRVRAQSLAAAELERAIEARLRQGYLREPSVSVEVEAFRPFFVLGEVTVAGQYPFISGMTVQKAIAVAGGFTPRAIESSVDVTRVIEGRSVTFPAPLTFPVKPGDTLTVGERFF